MLDLLRLFYLAGAVLLTLYACSSAAILLAYVFRRPTAPLPAVDDANLPSVCVQLPLYNEPRVAARVIDAAAAFDYPRAKLSIQVLDDSSDTTTTVAAARVAHWAACGLAITHIRRPNREGFKAGALAEGLRHTNAECIAIFDSDFVPPPGWLRSAAAHLACYPDVGMVQTRWEHLNAGANRLTRALVLALDAHFVVEQAGRHAAGWLMNFNGSGGLWRAQAIHDAGGWRATTLTEDLDLSYRAQLAGWPLAYRGDLVAAGEIPATLSSYRQQQERWATGGSQVFVLLIGPLWRTPGLGLMPRLMGTMHLGQYLVHSVIILILLLTPLLITLEALPNVNLGALSLAGLVPPLIIAAGQAALRPQPTMRVLANLPTLVLLATGMAWCNARAALIGLFKRGGEFHRTPKAGHTDLTTPAAELMPGARSGLAELALCAYAALGVVVAWRQARALVPYLALYTVAFGLMAFGLWWERRAQHAQ